MPESINSPNQSFSQQSTWLRLGKWLNQSRIYYGLVILFCILIPFVGNIYLHADYPSFLVKAACYASSVGLCIFAITLSIKVKYLAYIIIPVITMIAFLSYYVKSTLGIYIDYQIVASILETNWEETSSLASFSSVLPFVLLLLMISFLIWLSYKKLHHYLSWRSVMITGIICAVTRIVAFGVLGAQYYPNTFPVRYSATWPVIDITLNAEHLTEYYTVELKQFEYISQLPKPKLANHPSPLSADDECIAIFHLGESVRLDHLQLNGYPRETTPQLMNEKQNIASFKNNYSYGVVTRVSVVGMLTDAEVKSRKPTRHAFFSAFKDAGFKTCCLKQTSQSSVYDSNLNILLSDFDQHEQVYIDWERPGKFDQSIEKVKEVLTQNASEKKLFISLYDMGAHLPFVPFPQASHFKPDDYSQSNPLSDIPKAINSYDNCIREIDTEIHAIISQLKDKVAIYVYAADHGVALGENHSFCGGSMSPGTYRPAFFIWFSDKYKEKYPEIVQAVRQNMQKNISHDYIYHTMPSLCRLRLDRYKKELDLTNPEAQSFDPPEDLSTLTTVIKTEQ